MSAMSIVLYAAAIAVFKLGQTGVGAISCYNDTMPFAVNSAIWSSSLTIDALTQNAAMVSGCSSCSIVKTNIQQPGSTSTNSSMLIQRICVPGTQCTAVVFAVGTNATAATSSYFMDTCSCCLDGCNDVDGCGLAPNYFVGFDIPQSSPMCSAGGTAASGVTPTAMAVSSSNMPTGSSPGSGAASSQAAVSSASSPAATPTLGAASSPATGSGQSANSSPGATGQTVTASSAGVAASSSVATASGQPATPTVGAASSPATGQTVTASSAGVAASSPAATASGQPATPTASSPATGQTVTASSAGMASKGSSPASNSGATSSQSATPTPSSMSSQSAASSPATPMSPAAATTTTAYQPTTLIYLGGGGMDIKSHNTAMVFTALFISFLFSFSQ